MAAASETGNAGSTELELELELQIRRLQQLESHTDAGAVEVEIGATDSETKMMHGREVSPPVHHRPLITAY